MAAQAIPMSGTIGSALDVASQQMGSNIDRGRRVTLSDGRTYVQPFDRTPEGREETSARRERDRDVLLAQQVTERDAARAKTNEAAALANTARTGLKPNDRAYAATLQFARTPISDPNTGERTFPDGQEVAAFAQQAKVAAGQIYENAPITPRGLTKPVDVSQEDWDQYLRETGQTP
jgi:hypothetical protein